LCGLNCHIGEIGRDTDFFSELIELFRCSSQANKYRKLIFDKRNYNWIWRSCFRGEQVIGVGAVINLPPEYLKAGSQAAAEPPEGKIGNALFGCDKDVFAPHSLFSFCKCLLSR